MSAILLASGEHEIVTSVARCLGEAGKKVIIIGVDKCKGSLLSAYCHELYEVKPEYFRENSSVLVQLINEVAERKHCQVIMPISVNAACFLSNNRQALSPKISVTPISDEQVILKLNNKWELYCWLKDLQLPVPQTILLEDSRQAAAQNLGFPALIKPLEGGFGKGIEYYWNKEAYENNLPSQFPVIMQEYVPGWDMVVNVFTVKGEIRAVTMQQQTNGNFSFIHNEEALEICRSLLKAAEYTGISCFDLRYDERDGIIKCIECNPRCWGTIYASCQAGLNFPQLVYDMAKEGSSSIPNAVAPQWLPNPRTIWYKEPVKSLLHHKIVCPVIKKYISYYGTNLYYETYRILSYRKPEVADKWFKAALAGNKHLRNKYINCFGDSGQ